MTAPPAGVLNVTRATLPDGRQASIHCVDGTITSVAQPGPWEPTAGLTVDATGFVALPRLVDAHVHLDKTLLGPVWYPHHETSSLADRIRFEIDLLSGRTVEPIATRAGRLVDLAVTNGATALQSHVDVSAQVGLERLEAVMAVRDANAGRCDITLVAFPQEGVLASPGTADLLHAAVRSGCDAVGGLDPEEFDGDRVGQLDVVFAIAERRGVRIDIHLHENGQTGIDSILAIAERTRSLGMGGRVCISHGYALAQVPQQVAAATADRLAEAGVALVTSVPGQGLMPPLRLLTEHGVKVVVASDNIRDSWWPYGKADPLERICTAGYLAGEHGDAGLARLLTTVTQTPAELLGLHRADLSPGSVADFTLVPATSAAEAIVAQPAGRVVIRRGQIIAGHISMQDALHINDQTDAISVDAGPVERSRVR